MSELFNVNYKVNLKLFLDYSIVYRLVKIFDNYQDTGYVCENYISVQILCVLQTYINTDEKSLLKPENTSTN